MCTVSTSLRDNSYLSSTMVFMCPCTSPGDCCPGAIILQLLESHLLPDYLQLIGIAVGQQAGLVVFDLIHSRSLGVKATSSLSRSTTVYHTLHAQLSRRLQS